ncbi:MAG: filamentous hemagglutinin family protein, partial [Geobacteraceae bacterium]|nr:filamentous hemagglutinin family protein [Geobacteraceae bacterium]
LGPKTARERSTKGGSLFIGAPDMAMPGTDISYVLNDIIVNPGALINFSGGGFRYAPGVIETSRLLSGTTIYDISTAPQWLAYSKLLTGKQSVGARTVGSDAGKVTLESRVVLLNGTLKADVTRGLYQTAITSYTNKDRKKHDISVARGLERPDGGTLLIGRRSDSGGDVAAFQDFRTREIVISANPAVLSLSIGPDDLLSDSRSIISAQTLSCLNLGMLGLYANTGLTIERGARLSLLPGGTLEAMARVIDHQGEIVIPGGTVSLRLQDNISSHQQLQQKDEQGVAYSLINDQYAPLIESFTMESGSIISVAGEQIDNSLASLAAGGLRSGITTGGTITIKDNTTGGTKGVVTPLEGYDPGGHNLIIRSGAKLDVSGGYLIDAKGKVSGGDAGTLELRSATMSLAGDLHGLSLAGKKGGQLILHAGEIQVVESSLNIPDQIPVDAAVPDTLRGKLVLGAHRFEKSGFGRIELDAINNIYIADGISLTPSVEKIAQPKPAYQNLAILPVSVRFAAAPAGSDVSPDVSGETSIKLVAGSNIYTDNDFSNGSSKPASPANTKARISVGSGSRLATIPGGTITLQGPVIRVDGAVESLSGSITLKADGASAGDVSIGSGASILASGYNKPTLNSVAGIPAGSIPQKGGTVSLESVNGQVILEQGGLIDLSGSAPVTNIVKNAAGIPVPVIVAGTPGTLNITSANGFTLDGQINGRAGIQGQTGGTLSVRTNQSSKTGLLISEEDMRRYMVSGFDALTFGSASTLAFQGSAEMKIGRSLTLDAPLIMGSGSDNVTLSAPWIRLINTGKNLPLSQPVATGSAVLTLSSEWLDLEGSSSLAGFATARLLANKDMRLSDSYYGTVNSGVAGWYGGLQASGDLVLQGSRIYPTTASEFLIKSGGTVTILPSATVDSSPIYSAGGSLTIDAAVGINHSGYLAAPMGQITLLSDSGRIYLADGSVTKTSGDTQVNYGSFDGTYWRVKATNPADPTSGTIVTTQPKNAISIDAKEVIVREGATIDTSGGGSISSYLFQSGIEGSYNPISIIGSSSVNNTLRSGSNRFVILPDNSVQIPGFTYTDASGKTKLAGAVHLEATRLDDGTWLKEGTYSLLPEAYAFVPGARIISDLGTSLASGMKLRTNEGYQMVAGYDTYAGTGATNSFKGYSIRLATDVLKEGNFSTKQIVSGNSGDLTINAKSTILSGTLKRNALSSSPADQFKQGSLILSGKNITIQEGTVNLPVSFGFDTPLAGDFFYLDGTMLVAGSALSSGGGGPLTIGDASLTDSITVKAGSQLNVSQITLLAKSSITLESQSQINAGIATLTAHDGTVSIQSSATVNASDKISLDVNSLDLQGDLKSGHDMSLTSKNIFIAPDGESSSGLHLSSKLIESFKSLDNVSLTSTGDSKSGGAITFLKDVTLEAKNSLTIDAARLVNGGAANSPYTVAMSAPVVNLQNSGKAPDKTIPLLPVVAGSSFTVNANRTTLSNDIVVDGFNQVNFKALADLDPLNTVKAVNDLTFAGQGSLKTGGDLNISAARITTTFTRGADNVYHGADFNVTANGDIVITKSVNGVKGDTTIPGGILSMTGSSIKDSGNIVLPSGQVNLTATTGDITLEGAAIQAGGFSQLAADGKTWEYSPGGQINLHSSNGSVKLLSDAATNSTVLDVSAADYGDAGTIALLAPTKGVDLSGASLKGSSANGRGGSFAIDTDSLDTVNGVNQLSGLIDKLGNNGFNNRLNIRTRNGNLLFAGKTITARELVMAADGGDLTLGSNGRIDVSNSSGGGGRAELYASGSLSLLSGSGIDVHGTGYGANGGEIWLGSGNNNDIVNSRLLLASGSQLDLAGGQAGNGGSVYLRGLRNGSGVNMDLRGKIKGASQIVAEATRVYINTSGTVSANDQADYRSDAETYMSSANVAANRNSLLANLTVDTATKLHFRPGVEVRRSGDLALGADWDLTGWRFDNGTGSISESGVLTLRASGNLAFGSSTSGFNLTDHPTAATDLVSSTMQNSWAFNLAAGADLTGANPLATRGGSGNLLLGPSSNGVLSTDTNGNANGGAIVYTENAPLRFASGGSTDIGYGLANNYMINSIIRYNIGTYGGVIRGETGDDLTIRAGAIQSAVGDIDLRVGGNLNLLNKNDSGGRSMSLGTIRTTGEYSPGATVENSPGGSTRLSQMTDYWTYANGGNITLDVSGAVNGGINTTTTSGNNAGLGNAWDAAYGGDNFKDKFLTASYGSTSNGGTDASEGIITMAGGNIDVRAGGNFTSQTGAFGKGNLQIISGGDLNGRFRLMKGDGELSAMGNFGSATDSGKQVLELADARITVSSQGDMHIGTVLNPDNSRDKLLLNNSWNLTYSHADTNVAGSRNSGAAFRSLNGSVVFDGISGYDGYLDSAIDIRRRIVTPEFSILAADDILLKSKLALAPSSTGNLVLVAGNSIDGTISSAPAAQVAMVDVRPENVYGRLSALDGSKLQATLFQSGYQPGFLLHTADNVPVEITAVRGDISNLQLDLNKQATITAGNDIRELKFLGQNTGATVANDNLTLIRAGHDIYYSYVLPQATYSLGGAAAPGIRLGGAGTLLVQAGNNIDLGNSAGIQSFGNRLNTALGSKGSDLFVIAGAKTDITRTEAVDFFYGADHAANDGNGNGLREAGIEYTNLKNKGETVAADQRLATARNEIIRKYFKEKSGDGSGSISMVSSQISTLTGPDEIFVLARTDLNVGKSTFSGDSSDSKSNMTGISTTGGGPINIYAGHDINVNESRVMTLLGGNITVWSDQGDINAGRGSKTTVAPPQTKYDYDPNDSSKIIGFHIEPPSIGSGIRAVTFDPNPTPAGTLPVPEPGNIYGFAPDGKFDAGEAGVYGGKILIGAAQVVNAKNITNAAGSVGVPTSSEGGVSIGALAGSGGLADNNKMIEQSTAMGNSKEKSAIAQANQMEDFMSKIVDVKVVSFDTDENLTDQEKKEREKKEKEKKEKK